LKENLVENEPNKKIKLIVAFLTPYFSLSQFDTSIVLIRDFPPDCTLNFSNFIVALYLH
jgi:hypothetical protein